MFVIKNKKTQKFAKHTGETVGNKGLQYTEYPWEMVDKQEDAQQYTTLEHANEVAFWELSAHEEWVMVNTETDEEFLKKVGKYFPV